MQPWSQENIFLQGNKCVSKKTWDSRTGEGFAARMCQVSGWQKEVDDKEQGAILTGNDLFNKVK